jgi:hypothetical protein
MRRTQVWFKGHIGSPKISYFIRLDGNSDTNGVNLAYAQLDYKWSDNLTFTGGRFKPLFSREENISSGAQMAAERSAVNEAFNVGFAEGIAATYTANTWRVSGSVNDGARSGEAGATAPTGGGAGNYGFLAAKTGNSFNGDGTNVGLTGRADYKVFGDWSSWNDFSSWSGEEKSLFVGAGVHYQDQRVNQNSRIGAGFGEPAAARNADSIMWTTDIGYKANGLSLFASAYGNHVLSGGGVYDPTNPIPTLGNPGAQYSDYGFQVMAGYMVIPDVLQPFVRYEFITFDRSRNEDPNAAGFGNPTGGNVVNAVHDVNLITVGYNWYFKKNDAKFTLDMVWAIDTVNSAAIGGTSGGTFAGAGLLPDAMFGNGAATAENQVAIRAQFQLQF